MLVLTRKIEQSVMIGEDVEVVILQIKGNNVKLGIRAPKENPVYRREIYEQIKEQNKMAAMASVDAIGVLQDIVPQLPPKPQTRRKIL